jgi:hypothetical protein
MSPRHIRTGALLLVAGILFANVVSLDYNWRFLPRQGITVTDSRAWSFVGHRYMGQYLQTPAGVVLATADLVLLLSGAAILCWPRNTGDDEHEDDT